MNSRFYPYATDSDERDVLAYYFAGIAIALAYVAYVIAEAFRLQVPWWVALPSPMPTYLVIRGVFTRYVWRWPLLHRLRIVKIIDLNGTYEGKLWTSYQGGKTHDCTFIISQTWTRISIRGLFATSTSFNMVTGISVEDTAAPRLTYEYWNTPSSSATLTMQAHRGTIWFDILVADGDLTLNGEFYTGRGRETIGHIEVTRRK